ncbi:MAG: SRPBCC family protein [Bacteroidia bacterium]
MQATPITIMTRIAAPVATVWKAWTDPAHIMQWNAASDDWHCPHAINDLRVGGRFSSTMASRDGQMSFDFEGTYDAVVLHRHLAYTLDDGRGVQVDFVEDGEMTTVVEAFDPEGTHPEDMQRAGWQAILDRFGLYVETHAAGIGA